MVPICFKGNMCYYLLVGERVGVGDVRTRLALICWWPMTFGRHLKVCLSLFEEIVPWSESVTVPCRPCPPVLSAAAYMSLPAASRLFRRVLGTQLVPVANVVSKPAKHNVTAGVSSVHSAPCWSFELFVRIISFLISILQGRLYPYWLTSVFSFVSRTKMVCADCCWLPRFSMSHAWTRIYEMNSLPL